MSGHTPGPWVLHPTSTHPAVRSVGTAEVGPRRICTVGTMNGAPADKANALLIAAAPDLLALADAVIAAGPAVPQRIARMAHVARALATGEASRERT